MKKKNRNLLRIVSYDNTKSGITLIDNLNTYDEARLFKEHFIQVGYIEKNLTIEPYLEEINHE